MKTLALIMAAFVVCVSPAFAVMDHSQHGKGVAHEEIVEGVKVTFTVQTMKDAMAAMNMAMPKGIKETHHISAAFKDVKSGKVITEGEMKLKVQAPDKSSEVKDMMAMQGHFGADFTMPKKGKYGIMAKFKLKGGNIKTVKFWYDLK